MFPVETLSPTYYEERTAAEAAKRLAQQQQEAALQAQTKAPTASQQSRPSNVHAALSQPPPLSSPGSSSVLGSIFQGLVKRAPNSPASSTPAFTPPRAHSPAASTQQQKDVDALVAELQRQRDTDIVSLVLACRFWTQSTNYCRSVLCLDGTSCLLARNREHPMCRWPCDSWKYRLLVGSIDSAWSYGAKDTTGFLRCADRLL